jgi:hypothetical protein
LPAHLVAVEDPTDYSKNGILYGMEPTLLHDMEGGNKSIEVSGQPRSKPLFDQALRRPSAKTDKRILAVLSDHIDVRHLVQSATFTVHGRNEKLNQDNLFLHHESGVNTFEISSMSSGISSFCSHCSH